MPYKTRRGRVKNRRTGKTRTATYYPRSDGGHVAQSGPHKGKRVAVRDMGKDQKRRSKHRKPSPGYGHRTDRRAKRK